MEKLHIAVRCLPLSRIIARATNDPRTNRKERITDVPPCGFLSPLLRSWKILRPREKCWQRGTWPGTWRVGDWQASHTRAIRTTTIARQADRVVSTVLVSTGGENARSRFALLVSGALLGGDRSHSASFLAAELSWPGF